MQSVRLVQNPTATAEDMAVDRELQAALCDEVAELVLAVRAALREGRFEDLRQMAHPLVIRREQARLAKRFGAADAVDFWGQVTAEVEAVRMVSEGVAEAYEHVRHHSSGTSLRLVSTAEYVKGRWRITDAREAGDERVTAVLLRGAPPDEPFDGEAWTRSWTEAHGPTARLTFPRLGHGIVEHPEEGWAARVRVGSGRDLARLLGALGGEGELLEKQPAATVLSLVPAQDARRRTEQIRWLSRVAASLGARDASSIWVPSAAKAVPFPTWHAAVDGPLELPSLFALWLRTQRQRGTWVTRGMTTFMLPEVEVWCAGLTVNTVRALLRETAGRLLAHHEERVRRALDASAPAVPALSPRIYRSGARGLAPVLLQSLETVLELGDRFVAGDVEATLSMGRQGPRSGESYGRWGALALRTEPAWWVRAA